MHCETTLIFWRLTMKGKGLLLAVVVLVSVGALGLLALLGGGLLTGWAMGLPLPDGE
jgi:hypothetical protein